MSILYNDYLTGAEREAAIIIAESDAQFAKLNVLLETVAATREANYLAAEAKVFAESGTYDDLTMLYTEANQEAEKKEGGIFKAIWRAIKGLFARIGTFLTDHFGGDSIPKNGANMPSDVENHMNIFQRIWSQIQAVIASFKAGKVKDGCLNLLKLFKPDTLGLPVVFGAATTWAIVKRDTIKSWIANLNKVSDDTVDAMDAVEKTGDDVDTAVGGATNVASAVAGAVAGDDAAKAVKDAGDTAKDKIKAAFENAKGVFKAIADWILKTLGRIKTWCKNALNKNNKPDEEATEESNDEQPTGEPTEEETPVESGDPKPETKVDEKKSETTADKEKIEKPYNDDGTIKSTPAEIKKQTDVSLSRQEKKAAIEEHKKNEGKTRLSKKEQKKVVADAKADKKAKANGRVSKSGALDTWDEDEFNESVSLLDIDLDSDETFLESVMTDEEYNELAELFNNL